MMSLQNPSTGIRKLDSLLSELVKVNGHLWWGTQNPGTSSSWWQYFFMVTPNVCGSQVRNSLLVTLLVPRILRCFTDFWKICAPLVQGHLNFNLEDFERNYQHVSNITAVCIISPDIIYVHLSGFCHTGKGKKPISQVQVPIWQILLPQVAGDKRSDC
jgi:hypothetical protein